MRVKLITLRNTVLKELLEEYGLAVTGNKTEMVRRLQEHLGSDEIDQPEEEERQTNATMQQQIDDIKLLIGRLAVGMQNLTAQRENITTPSLPTPTSNVESVSVGVDTLSTNTQHIRSFSVKEIAETIPTFDPTDNSSLTVERFVDRVDQIRLTHNFNEKSLLLAVYSRMKGAARLWMDALPTLFATWTSFSEALCNEFQEELDETAIHTIMAKTIRQTDETPVDYCFRISAVGKRHGLTDRAIIRHARSGMRNREFQTSIAPLRIDSMRKFRETVTEYFDNSKPTVQQQPIKPKFNAGSGSSGRGNVGNTVAKPVRVICYNCLEEGHISAKCPKPQRTTRCKDCGRVHKKGEPTHCGKSLKVNKVAKDSDLNEKVIEVLGTNLKADIDTGSECDLIKRSIADKFKCKRQSCHVKITGIGGGTNLSTEYVNLPIRIDNANVELQLYVVNDEVIETDVLIGRPIFRDKTMRMTIQNGSINFEKIFNVETIRNKTAQSEINSEDINCCANEPDVVEKLKRLINEYRQIFATDMSEIGVTNWELMHIKLQSPNATAQAPYRIPEKKKEIVDEMIRELLDCDIIENSTSNYASPILLHKKKTGGDRLCVDYRRLNAITEHEVFPMPNIEESLL